MPKKDEMSDRMDAPDAVEPKRDARDDHPEAEAAQPAPKPTEDDGMTPAEHEAPKQCPRTIEDLLADQSFDRDGKVRAKLAKISVEQGVGQMAPTDLVDEHGNAVAK